MDILMIPGAGGVGAGWSLVADRLREAGHIAITPDLPTGIDQGISQYADAVVEASNRLRDITLVSHSMGAFTAAMASSRLPLSRMMFLNGMIPVPGESAGAWWDAVGFADARAKADREAGRDPDAEFDLGEVFFHDVPDDRRASIESVKKPPDADTAFTEPADFAAWPQLPTRVLIGRDDRFFPAEFQHRVARERLKAVHPELIEVPGGHMAALAYPDEIAAAILAA